jgi:hypothetical protein
MLELLRVRWPFTLATSLLVSCNILTNVDDLTIGEPDLDADARAGDAATALDGSSRTLDASVTADVANESDAPVPTPLPCGRGVADPDLVAYYPLDEDAGAVARDCSGHGHDGTVISTVDGGSWTPGIWGGGFRGDGTAGCIELGSPPDLLVEQHAFTVATWVRAKTYSGPSSETRYVVGRALSADVRGWRVGGDSPSKLDFELAVPDASSIFVNSNALATETWVHVAVTFEPGTRVALYVDGTLTSLNTNVPKAIFADETASVRIACRGQNDRWFDGTIDELRIYRRALSAAEIAALANKP